MPNRDNPGRGKAFEKKAQEFFKKELHTQLDMPFEVEVGAQRETKPRRFDLGSSKGRKPIIIECKCHTWTKSNNSPSAKLTAWNEAMYFFNLVDSRYRKILAVMKSVNQSRKRTLTEEYLDRFGHLIPKGVEIWEYDKKTKKFDRVFPM